MTPASFGDYRRPMSSIVAVEINMLPENRRKIGLIGMGRGIGDKGIDLGRRRRQSGQVQWVQCHVESERRWQPLSEAVVPAKFAPDCAARTPDCTSIVPVKLVVPSKRVQPPFTN